MGKWIVRLIDTKEKDKVLEEALVEGETQYQAERNFFTLLIKLHPELKKIGITAIEPFIRVKKRKEDKLDLREETKTLLDKTFKRKTLPTTLENLLDSSYLEDLSEIITSVGLTSGLVPSVCPVCKTPIRQLHIHHWKYTKRLAIKKGEYRRLCIPCHFLISRTFKGNYPEEWEPQLEVLKLDIEKRKEAFPDYNGKEGNWSRITKEEFKILEDTWNSLPPELHQKLVQNRKKLKDLIREKHPEIFTKKFN